MTAVYIPFYRQRTLPNINEERSVQGQINQIIIYCTTKTNNNKEYTDNENNIMALERRY